MLNAVRRAMVHRRTILLGYAGDCPTPSNKELLSGVWLDMAAWDQKEGEELPEVEFPSFVKAWKASHRQIIHHGYGAKTNDLNNSHEDLVDLFDY